MLDASFTISATRRPISVTRSCDMDSSIQIRSYTSPTIIHPRLGYLPPPIFLVAIDSISQFKT